jgi:hypothetical protein
MALTDYLTGFNDIVQSGAGAFSTVKDIVKPAKKDAPTVTTPGGANLPSAFTMTGQTKLLIGGAFVLIVILIALNRKG